MCDCYTFHLAKKKIKSYTIETVNPIDGDHTFDIVVRSPSETYYTEIFWSHILETNKALDLYLRLFYDQVQEKKTEMYILEKLKNITGNFYVTLENAFKIAYRNSMEQETKIPKPPEEKKNGEEIKKEVEEVKKDIINKKLK